jgi:hypothetical protein
VNRPTRIPGGATFPPRALGTVGHDPDVGVTECLARLLQ